MCMCGASECVDPRLCLCCGVCSGIELNDNFVVSTIPSAFCGVSNLQYVGRAVARSSCWCLVPCCAVVPASPGSQWCNDRVDRTMTVVLLPSLLLPLPLLLLSCPTDALTLATTRSRARSPAASSHCRGSRTALLLAVACTAELLSFVCSMRQLLSCLSMSRYLSLSNNRMTGVIPLSLGQAVSLKCVGGVVCVWLLCSSCAVGVAVIFTYRCVYTAVALSPLASLLALSLLLLP